MGRHADGHSARSVCIICSIFCRRKYDSISSMMRDLLHWLPIHQHIEFKLCLVVFKCSHNLVPKYLSDYCQLVSSNPGRRKLHLVARHDLVVPPTRTAHYGPRGFAVAGRPHGTHCLHHSMIAAICHLVPASPENTPVPQSIRRHTMSTFVTVSS